MALEKVSKILEVADKANAAVIGFNCIDYNMIRSCMLAAEETGKPIICMLYPVHDYEFNSISLSTFAVQVKELAKSVCAPIGLHLDHCSDLAYIELAVRSGFTSIMYDGSMLPYEENVYNTRKAVEMCKAYDVDVEAELGYVGVGSAYDPANVELYTKPELAADFVQKTKVDSLAVAIGNAHGVYKAEPRLDFERLDAINAATDIPLVLHGGSGIPDDQLECAFSRGISKFNVGTELWQVWKNALAKYAGDASVHPNEMSVKIQDTLKEYLRVKLELTKL